MRMSDWSSDVCSSDLGLQGAGQLRIEVAVLLIAQQKAAFVVEPDEAIGHALDRFDQQRTRACRLPLAVEEPALDGLTLRRVPWRQGRSEEHTSELQSLMRISYAVFCLKNNKTDKSKNMIIYTVNR